MTPKLRIFLLVFAVVLPLDQATKLWISANVHYAERIEIIPGLFDLTHVRNPGGAFSFFAHPPLRSTLCSSPQRASSPYLLSG